MSYSAFAKYLANAFLYKKKKKEKTFSWIPSHVARTKTPDSRFHSLNLRPATRT